uniref:L-serine deaminase n=1 Tax=Saccoglossus kowalevskii TaxID=10224 RepID=A0ABM0M8D0_SACKO
MAHNDGGLRCLSNIPLSDIREAESRLRGVSVRTPLIPYNVEDCSGQQIYLKLENLQTIGSFKLRGAYYAIKCLDPSVLKHGICTSSAGNFGQGLAWSAKQLDIPCTVIVPENAPTIKLEAIARHGGNNVSIKQIPYLEWWDVMCKHYYPGMQGTFIHPVCDADVIA